jgi:hypothetical protein
MNLSNNNNSATSNYLSQYSWGNNGCTPFMKTKPSDLAVSGVYTLGWALIEKLMLLVQLPKE